MRREVFLNAMEKARQSQEYRNYLEVRKSVLNMLEHNAIHADQPSNYWEEELTGFDYMLDASPLIVQKLREHCYHLTGLRTYDYRNHHARKSKPFARKLQALRQQDEDDLLVPESPLLGGFGHIVDGALINLDTLKFYESLIAMNKAGLLAPLRSISGQKKVVIEIGAGWGGFAYQFKTLCPNTCYVVVDLPQTLLFSGVYLKTLFPQASVLLYGDKPSDRLLDGCESYDFVLLPHFFFREIRLSKVDLSINMVSFQEMTSVQVDEYVQGLAKLGCPNIYSHNRDCSSHNNQLSTVSSIISNYYDIVEQKVLDSQYTQLTVFDQDKQQQESVHDYRHLIGPLKQKGGRWRQKLNLHKGVLGCLHKNS